MLLDFGFGEFFLMSLSDAINIVLQVIKYYMSPK